MPCGTRHLVILVCESVLLMARFILLELFKLFCLNILFVINPALLN